jgi:hypothetical protein
MSGNKFADFISGGIAEQSGDRAVMAAVAQSAGVALPEEPKSGMAIKPGGFAP